MKKTLSNVLRFPIYGIAALAVTGYGYATDPIKPNVIFILADDVGYGDFSTYGASKVATPNVDRLAGNGVKFTNAHAVAATSTPSRYSLLTGQYAFRRNDTGVAAGNAASIIKPHQETVPKLFKAAGYTTGAVGKWHLGLGKLPGSKTGMAKCLRGRMSWDLTILISWQQQPTVFHVYLWKINKLHILTLKLQYM